MPDRAVKWLLWQLAHANLVLAVSTAAAVYVAEVLLSMPEGLAPPAIAFLVTFAVYNFNRQTDKKEDSINHPKRVAFLVKYGKMLAILSIFAYILAIWLSFYGGSGAQFIVMLPLIAVLLYGLRWIPKNGDKAIRLKEIFFIKNLIVSITWAGSVTFLPILYYEVPITTTALLIFGFFFSRFFINTVVFDLRDILGDQKEHINSIPAVLGYHRTRNILHALNLLFGSIFLLMVMVDLLHAISLPLIFSMVYAFAYLTYLKLERNIHFVCDVLVDGEYFALAAFYYLLYTLL